MYPFERLYPYRGSIALHTDLDFGSLDYIIRRCPHADPEKALPFIRHNICYSAAQARRYLDVLTEMMEKVDQLDELTRTFTAY